MIDLITEPLIFILAFAGAFTGSMYGFMLMKVIERKRHKRIAKKKAKPKVNESNTPTKKTKKSLPFLKPKEKKEPAIKYVKGELNN